MAKDTIPSTPQRRRGAELEKILLDAAWTELKAVGYTQLTYDAVANRAGTSRPILYRRWPHKHDLVIAAMRDHTPMLSGPIPDTGSLRSDVIRLLERSARQLRAIGQEVMLGLMSDIVAKSDKVSHAVEVSNIGREVMTTILRRADERGELNLKAIPEPVITLPLDLNRHEILVTGKPPSHAKILQIVDEIFLPLVKRPSR
ncbi:MAG TPA: TetR/AcrR family transcriptional regulator [Verrucomicrobiae bacterium]|nr:TetR/AcrR family transcriptional regulator [Verrucomicrobiae bacterium]